MTGLLTAAAIVTTISLLVSASHTGSTATASDSQKRGPWGIVRWTSQRNRPLDPHERRWQTALLSGKDNPSRWRDLVTDLHALERTSAASPTGPAPEEFDNRWIEASIANLESAINDKSPGESPR